MGKMTRNYFKKGDYMKKLLSILTACMLVTNFTFAGGVINQVREGLRVRDVTVNNPGPNPTPIVTTTPIPFANVYLQLPRGSDVRPLVPNEPLQFNDLKPSVDKTFFLDTKTSALVLLKEGLYTVNFSFTLQNADSVSLAGIYAALDGKILPRTATFRTISGNAIEAIDGTFTFEAKVGQQLTFVYTSRGTYRIPRGPRLEPFDGQIRTADWTPETYNITYLGHNCSCS